VASIKQAYRFALDPSLAQERALRSHAGAARFAWNWGLAKCKDRYATERKWYSATDLHKLWTAEKKADPDLAWWAENSKCCYQEAFRNLERALRDFVKSGKGQREGKRLFRLIWDTCAPAFASRQALYEYYFFGDPVRTASAYVASYDKSPYVDRVRAFLEPSPT